MAKTNSLPGISIVMPSFNSEQFIAKSIDSVVSQKYPNLELFIKDGGSTDKTVEIIKKYAKKYPKIIKFISKKDQGQTAAINYGLKQVNHEIVSFLNSDDVYKPGTLKIIGEFFMQNPDLIWCVGKCDIIDDKGQEIMQFVTEYKNAWLRFPNFSTLLILNYISQMAVFWKRSVHQKVGYLDEKEHYVMDYEFWLRLWSKYNPKFIDQTLASFRVTKQTKSSTGFTTQFKDELKVAQKYTNNKFILGLHYLHSQAIMLSYSLLK